MLNITPCLQLKGSEIEISAIRSGGPGGQHVNKVATAIHLRFDIINSSLPDPIKQRLLSLSDSRVTKEGVIIIKSSESRSQEKNRHTALMRLAEIIRSSASTPKKRVSTKPSRAAVRKRVEQKRQRKQIKKLRGKVKDY